MKPSAYTVFSVFSLPVRVCLIHFFVAGRPTSAKVREEAIETWDEFVGDIYAARHIVITMNRWRWRQ